MKLKNILFISLALSVIPAAQAEASKGIDIKNMTCAQFLDVDYATVPVVVGFLYHYSFWTGDTSVTEVDDLDDVEVDDVSDYCQKNPTAKASSAVKKAK